MPCGWLMFAVSATEAYVDGFTVMSVVYGVGRMPSPSGGWNETYVPTPRVVVAVSDGRVVNEMAMKSLHPSPICSALFRQLTFAGPPVRRLEMPCVYSCAITPASRSESR